MNNQDATAVQAFKDAVLPTKTGEYIKVTDMGAAGLNETDYNVEILFTNYYKITKK